MGLHDRELSPLSSNDIGDKISRTKVNDMPNHFNKSMKRSVTDTIRDQLDGDSDMPIMSIQKPAYIPGECHDASKCFTTTLIAFFSFKVKRPDQAYNQKPKLGSKHKNRQGYHYEPIASTSRQSPTFIIDPEELDFDDQDDDDELIIPIGPGHKFAW